MHPEELKTLFDQQAAVYDTQWARMAPVRDGLYFLLESVFAGLPEDARLLCVGAGTGVEIAHLARRFPRWHFTAVEPSGPMLALCRQRAEAEGYLARCTFHEGYLDSLPAQAPHHGATCLLVSHFMLEPKVRTAFFREIAQRLTPGGVLANADLAADTGAPDYDALLRLWIGVMSSAGVAPEVVERTRAAYARDVAMLPPDTVAALMAAAGFTLPVPFFQSGLMHGWFAQRV